MQSALSNLFGLGKKEPWMDALRNTQYKSVDRAKMGTLFDFLAFCLKQVSSCLPLTIRQYFSTHLRVDICCRLMPNGL